MTLNFKPSIYRISSLYLSEYGIKGSWDDLREIEQWIKGYDVRIYPNCLDRRWPIHTKYFRPFDHPDYRIIQDIVDGWPKFWSSYRMYIKQSIKAARYINQSIKL